MGHDSLRRDLARRSPSMFWVDKEQVALVLVPMAWMTELHNDRGRSGFCS